MLPPKTTHSQRREFLRDALRYSALAGIAGLITSAVARRGVSCTRQPFCDGCSQFAGCDESQAQATKEAAITARGAT